MMQDPRYQEALALSNFAKISKTVIGAKETWKTIKNWIEDYTEEHSNKRFKDMAWEGLQGLGELVGRNLMCFHEIQEGLEENELPEPKVVLKSLKELNGGQEPALFGDCRIRNQRILDQSFVYLIDALNTISTQPSLIYMLFERTKLKKDGIHPVWINTNGKW